ncbi:TIGR00730 family Rossman fold protein [Aliidiomarina iranensis]|uniref:Cytokinin riboside 5'-monophosphate phosphoribohydrolase n=1 Tax=Aliidiomarina iranensis TaxID=1434071 RepID=A0A432VWN0_9GAMM|nr:TIGR00730 family Rossman fold protein [Aliidiomarina iranensis]RUO21114.1 TIGR00730 family Rossman fold protein [Aliidiomarina iranensis]
MTNSEFGGLKEVNEPELSIAEDTQNTEMQRAAHLANEWMLAEETFNGEDVLHTISIFGSARIPAPEKVPQQNPCESLAHFYQQARQLAFRIGQYIEAEGLSQTRLITGGGPGIMEAGSRGANEAGHASIGLNIALPHEQRLNPFIAAKHSINFQYFALRKMHFLKRAQALIVFPGGFGTLDELFETLTLIQTGKMPRIPVFLYGKTFWNGLINLELLAAHNLIDPEDLALYHLVDSVEEAWQEIQPILLRLKNETLVPSEKATQRKTD